MEPDAASLSNLQDIVVPPPVPWWPPAPGWWFVAAAVLIAGAVLAKRMWRRWKSNAYRREALLEIESASSVEAISEILKRAALVAFPRIEVASLSGQGWIDWLSKSGGETVPDAVAEAFNRGVCDPAYNEHLDESAGFARRWIRRHDIQKSELKAEATGSC
ncbi:MAG: DUF4381 domain-containing protein [Candidatus Omnitrophica bacterium]|nr:DUF4381 domain-containing protein [Candidatus Omnitrophota bacterium]MCB9769390.1 DUF4381 domain-containing protein [Candidatus Omnitrophota bacterium]